MTKSISVFVIVHQRKVSNQMSKSFHSLSSPFGRLLASHSHRRLEICAFRIQEEASDHHFPMHSPKRNCRPLSGERKVRLCEILPQTATELKCDKIFGIRLTVEKHKEQQVSCIMSHQFITLCATIQNVETIRLLKTS